MPHFFLQIAAALPLVPIGIALFFWKEVNWQLRRQDSLLGALTLRRAAVC